MIKHATFTIERTYPAPLQKVWRAWAEQESKAKWFRAPEGWEPKGRRLEFVVGGTEHVASADPNGTVHEYDATYQDIKPGERFVTTYTMSANGVRTSVSVATVEFDADGDKTTVTMTEHGVFFDELDRPEWREEGTNNLLDALGRAL